VLWGCPSYRLMDGWNNTDPNNDNVRSGYAMNPYPLLPDFVGTYHERAYIGGAVIGRYFKEDEWKGRHGEASGAGGGASRLLIGEGLIHFLELSIRVKPERQEADAAFQDRASELQRDLHEAVRRRGVAISDRQENKTQRVLAALAATHR